MGVLFARRSAMVTVMTVLVVLVVSSCSFGDEGPTPSPTTPAAPARVDAIAALVPDSIRQTGTLVIGTDPSYPPMEFREGDVVTGVDIDLASGIAAVLGLTPEFRLDAYSALGTGVRTGRYDMGIASLTVTPDTQLRSNAVLYFRSGSQLVRNQSQAGLTPDNMCGRPIAAIEGSIQVQQLSDADKVCRQQGLERIEIVALSTQEEVTNAVVLSDADAMLSDRPVAEYAVGLHEQTLELAGPEFDRAPLGILVSADFPKLTKAIRRAVQQLIDTGYYQAVLDAWGLETGGIRKASIKWAK